MQTESEKILSTPRFEPGSLGWMMDVLAKFGKFGKKPPLSNVIKISDISISGISISGISRYAFCIKSCFKCSNINVLWRHTNIMSACKSQCKSSIVYTVDCGDAKSWKTSLCCLIAIFSTTASQSAGACFSTAHWWRRFAAKIVTVTWRGTETVLILKLSF